MKKRSHTLNGCGKWRTLGSRNGASRTEQLQLGRTGPTDARALHPTRLLPLACTIGLWRQAWCRSGDTDDGGSGVDPAQRRRRSGDTER
jgi:hypothetical protein